MVEQRKTKPPLDAVDPMEDLDFLQRAMRAAHWDAIREHQAAGVPLVYWDDERGEVIYKDPDEAAREMAERDRARQAAANADAPDSGQQD